MSNYTLLKKVHSLATGPEWNCEQIKVMEDEADEDGVRGEEELELWHRNPITCIQELFGNSTFQDSIAYVLQRVYTNAGGSTRRYDEMWTGDWWWKTQVCTLSNFTPKFGWVLTSHAEA